jgi:hypothetical protein
LTLKILNIRQEINEIQGKTGLTKIYPSIWQLDQVLINIRVNLANLSLNTISNRGHIQGIPEQQKKIN